MFLPKLFKNIKFQSAAHEVFSSPEMLLQRILACNRNRFSGCLILTVLASQMQTWSLYFLNGRLVGGIREVHPVRCWYQQIVRYCPQLSHQIARHLSDFSQLCDYSSLAQRVTQGQLLQSQMIAVVKGYLSEILFDFIQAQQFDKPTSDIQVDYYTFCQEITALPSVLIQPVHTIQQATQVWSAWNRVGLKKWSPNLAPVIQDAEALRRQTSPTVFKNLTQLIDGDRTLRDLAIIQKQHLLLLTRSIMPYVTQGMMDLVTVPDMLTPPRLARTTSVQPVRRQPTDPLIAYLEDSRFDRKAMEQILRQAGYRFTSIGDSVQALPWLLEQKPDLIFLDVLMPDLSGYEICSLIRQVSMLKDTPIIIVSSRDGIADRTRAKTVGASDFLAKPITSEKVLAILWKHLLIPPSPSQHIQPAIPNL
ncbi:MAG: response regulator [Cyanobacteria bacterium J06639_14]